MFEALSTLVRDAATLRVYLAAAMRVEAETFTRATETGRIVNGMPLLGQNGLANGQNGLASVQNGYVAESDLA